MTLLARQAAPDAGLQGQDSAAAGNSVETAAAKLLESLEERQQKKSKPMKRPAAAMSPEDGPLACPINPKSVRPAPPLKYNGFTVYTDVPGKRFKIKDSDGAMVQKSWAAGIEKAWHLVAELVTKKK